MYIIVAGWLYVALMMAVAEGTNSTGSLLGAIITFLLYGVAPVSLLIYLLGTPARKRAIRAREAAASARAAEAASSEPDSGGKAAAEPIAPVRKEP